MSARILFGAIAVLDLRDVVTRDLVQDPQIADRTLGAAGGLMMIGSLAA
jgi:hypothetical protein